MADTPSDRKLQTVMAGVVAVLLLVAGAVTVDRFGDSSSSPSSSSTGYEPVTGPDAPSPGGPPSAADSPADTGPGVAAPASSSLGTGTSTAEATTASAPPGEEAAVPSPVAPATAAGAPDGAGRGGADSPARPAGADPGPSPDPGTAEPAPAPPPPPAPSPPEPEPALAGSASVGEGATGAVAGVAVPRNFTPGSNSQVDVDVTLGTNQLVGDAPPSRGTSVDVGGSLLPVRGPVPVKLLC